MRAQRVQPNTITYVGEVSTFVKSFGEVTDDGGHFSNRYNAAIQACDRGGVWQRAVELFDAMEVEGIARDAITYNAIAQACQRAGQWDLAKEYRERALHRSGARAARGPNEVWR
jgi:pentatricopeptide repeat domain-containing protein 1